MPALEETTAAPGGKKGAGQEPAKQDGEKKLSNAELKKQKKAEKAAKRAQEKPPEQSHAAQDQNAEKPAQSQQPRKKPSAQGTPPAQGPKAQEKKQTASQKSLPVRTAQTSEKTAPEQPTKELKRVALFGHLHGQPHRTTLAGASKDVHPAVLALGLQMSNYAVCGSSARCIATLLAFKRVIRVHFVVTIISLHKQVIQSYVTPPGTSLPRNLTAHLSPQIEYLISCRPMSASMGNAIRWLKLEINDVDIETPEERAKADLCEAIDNFIRERITVADEVIAATAINKIRDGDVILTFAKSHVVQQTLLEAYRQGVKFRVIVVDSRPLFEGKNLAKALADAGLEVQYSLTHAIAHFTEDATKVFLGAHSMLSNGRLYSRIGTAIVAMMAKEADVPVIVCCESVKFTDRVALDSIVTNEMLPPDELTLKNDTASPLNGWKDLANLQLLDLMYDVTPAEYITMVITEHGSLPPSSVPSIHRLSTNT